MIIFPVLGNLTHIEKELCIIPKQTEENDLYQHCVDPAITTAVYLMDWAVGYAEAE